MTNQFQMEKPTNGIKPVSQSVAETPVKSSIGENHTIANSSKMVAQTKRNQSLFGTVVQRDEWDEGELGQAKIEDQHTSMRQVSSSSASTGIPSNVQAKMEHAFNTDFSGVKVHPNSSKAPEVGALAYTQGTDIHFAPGQYNPSSSAGQKLLGHELTHVVQQAQGRVQPTGSINGMALNDSAALEKEADVMGQRSQRMSWQSPNQRSSANYSPNTIQLLSKSNIIQCMDQESEEDEKGQSETAFNVPVAVAPDTPAKKRRRRRHRKKKDAQVSAPAPVLASAAPLTCSVRVVDLRGNRGGPAVRKDKTTFSDGTTWSVKWAAGVGCVYFEIRSGTHTGVAYYNNEINTNGYKQGEMRSWLVSKEPLLGDYWDVYWAKSKAERGV